MSLIPYKQWYHAYDHLKLPENTKTNFSQYFVLYILLYRNIMTQWRRKIYLSLYLKRFEWVIKGFTVWKVSWRLNRTATYWPPTLMAITAFLSRSHGLLNQGPLWDMVLIPASSLQLIWTPTDLNSNCSIGGSWGPPLLGAGSLYSVFTPTDLNFLLPELYNNLTSTLLPASVTISHSIQPVHSQGYILIFLDWMHLLFRQVHFLFWQLGRVGGQYAKILRASF